MSMSVQTNLMPPHHGHHQVGLSDFIASPEKRTVPNHLLDTKIFSGVCDNEVFHCRPSVIHFQGFQAGRGKYTQKLKIINISSECQRVHVIPPSSSSFKIKYNKVDSLVPGMYLDVLVEFIPHENVYHYDCIRIHCKGDANNLTVPIHAYLMMDISSFPKNINFKPTQVGQSAVKKIPLKNDAAVDFDFQILFIQNHSAFDIYPLSGIVPGNNQIEILIKYSPNEYCTACANIQIIVSQFNCQPYHCYITGTCEPGIASKLKVKQIESTPRETVDPRRLSPLCRSQTRKQIDHSKSIKRVESKEIVKDGVRFPLDINGHSAVSHVLSQKAGKLKAKDLKDAVNKGKGSCVSKQMKEAVFEHLVSKNIAEEQRNQLRWGVKLGDCSISKLHHEDVIKQRVKSAKEYLFVQGDCDKDVEFKRFSTQVYKDRIRRSAGEQSLSQPAFDLFLNNDWEKRHMIMGKFVQAARKTIWILRATKSLKAMSVYLHEWRLGNFRNTRKVYDENNREQEIVENVTLETIGTKLQAFSFPEYNSSTQKDDMAVDALDLLTVKETVITSKTKICMYDLEVPLQYKLLHYNLHPFSSAVNNYIPEKLARKLKSGFEKEITTTCETPLPLDHVSENVESINIPAVDSKPKIPSYFLEEKSHHPLHIFNPMPGVRAHAEQLPYSEIDDDYSLSPLSRAMPKGLDREGVIPGVMNWKKFPSHGLVAMSTPSLYHVYVPRWSDPFSEELIPAQAPELLSCLPSDDQLDSAGSDDLGYVPNMNMVRAEFAMVEDVVDQTEDSDTPFSVSMTLPHSNNPQSKSGMISREKMKRELNLHLHKQMNNLGSHVKLRVDQTKCKWDLDNLN